MINSTILGLLVVLYGLCCTPSVYASPVDVSGTEIQTLVEVPRGKMAEDFVATLDTNLANLVGFLASRFDRFLQRLVETIVHFVKCLFSIVDSALRWIVSSIASTLDWLLGSSNSRRSRSWMTNTSQSMDDYLQTLIDPVKDYVLEEVESMSEESLRRLWNYLTTRLLVAWLHTTSDKIDKMDESNTLFPTSLDAIYRMTQQLGHSNPIKS